MKEIPLTNGLVTLVDDADFDFLNQWEWYAYKHWRTYYAVRTRKKGEPIKPKAILMHRVILGLTDRNILCDHEDHNGLNNQRYNLREATFKQNSSNSKSRKSSTSQYLGVIRLSVKVKDKLYYYWRASLSKDKKFCYIGLFKTEEEAARAYDEAAKKQHGEFANLNFK